MILETVRVVNPSSDTGMLINAIDFDPAIHVLFDSVPPKTVAAEEKEEEDVAAPIRKGRPPIKNNKK